jgi:hypothetical protein
MKRRLRRVMAGSIGGLLVAGVAAAETARGVVFEDADGDALRDAGEPGLPGVPVSNGDDVVLTDAEGRYELEVGSETILFVSKPAGFQAPVDAHMLPRFYYIHQPEGSPPGLRYAGIEPTGPLPESVDFPLRRSEEPTRFEAILFADTQPQTAEEVDFVRDDVVSELIGTKARFGMTMGDILFDDLSLFPRLNSVIAQIGIPWYNVPGNHELNLLAPDDVHSLETFKRFFGPTYYSFDFGRAHFVVLDNIEYKGRGDTSDPANLRGSGGYEARFGKRQLAWLERDLEHVPKEKLLFLAMHAPLRTYTGVPDHPAANTQDRKKLFSLLRDRPNLYAVAGHTHTTEHHYFGRDDGFPGPGEFHHHVLTTVSGSWWSGPIDERGIAVADQRDGTPNGYHVLEIDGTQVRVRYKAAGMPDDFQMRIVLDVAHYRDRPEALRDVRPGAHLDGRISLDELPAAAVVVNLFDGGPRSSVDLLVPGRPPQRLERRMQPDPFVTELFHRNRDVVKPWVDAAPSSHVFVGDLPDDLSAGTYTLTVRATDEFGRVHHGHQVIEIAGTSAIPDAALRYPQP